MNRPRAYMPPLLLLLLLAIFVLDLYTPLGLAVGFLYLIPLAMASVRFVDRALFTVAALGTGLTVLGFFLSPPGVPTANALFNRALGIALLWLTAWFLVARRRTETVLKENEERLRIAQFKTRIGIWDWDLRTNLLTWTPELEQLYGLPPGAVRSYEDFRQRVHPDDLSRVEAQQDDAIRSRRTFEIEFRIIRPSGEIRWIESRGNASYDEAGEPVHVVGNNCDITDRKQAEATRQALLDAAPDATVTINRAGGIVHVNRQMEQVFGYLPDELLGQPIEILIPARFHQRHQAHRDGFMAAPRRRAMGEGQALFARHKDGTEFPVEISLSPIDTAEGPQVIASIRDITDRKQAESALRDIRERLDLALKGSSDGLWDWDITTGNDYLSPRWKAMLGFQDEELPNQAKSFFSRVHPDDAERVSAAVQAHLEASAPYDLELRLRMKDESYRWFRSRGEAVRDAGSKPTRMVGLITDITDHKQTEAALRLLQQIGALFVRERDPAAALDQIVDTAITIMQADRGLLQLLDPRTGDLTIRAHRGFTQPVLDVWRHVAENQGACGQAMAQGERVVVEDVTHSPLFADPTTREVMRQAGVRAVVSTPLRSRSGALLGRLSVHYGAPTKPEARVWPLLDLLVGQTADLLDRAKAEEAFRQVEEQLRQSQKMEAVGTLAGGIAHDFNNLLTVMLGYSVLALTRLRPENPPYRPLDEIRKAGERAAGLTSQLLAFSRHQVLSPVVLDLNQLIVTVGELLHRLIGAQIALEIRPQAASPLIEADRGQIEHVLVNLAVNARDAMPTGGQLCIETTNVEVDEAEAARHAGLRLGPYVQVTVRDTGHGMDQATQARVFEPFFTTKPPGKGTGLGLAMVYGSVRQSGGAIWLDSQPHAGTTFTLCFPTTLKPLAGVPPAAQLRGGQETILLAEDEPAVRTLAVTILSAQGYRVLDAPSGAEALRRIEAAEGPVHLLLTDVIMPGMNGRQLAAHLTARHPHLRVLFISGYNDDAILHTGVTEAGVPFLRKPFTPAALIQMVREVLDAPPRPPIDLRAPALTDYAPPRAAR